MYRVYRELGLAVRRKKRKRVAQANRLPRVVPPLSGATCFGEQASEALDPFFGPVDARESGSFRSYGQMASARYRAGVICPKLPWGLSLL